MNKSLHGSGCSFAKSALLWDGGYLLCCISKNNKKTIFVFCVGVQHPNIVSRCANFRTAGCCLDHSSQPVHKQVKSRRPCICKATPTAGSDGRAAQSGPLADGVLPEEMVAQLVGTAAAAAAQWGTPLPLSPALGES